MSNSLEGARTSDREEGSEEPVTVLEIRDLSHRYGDFLALDTVDLDLRDGEVHCLLGESGSGKSTLLRLIAGLEVLQRGFIEVAGEVLASDGTRARRFSLPPELRPCGFVFQDYALFPHLDVVHNVMFGMERGSRAEKRRAGAELLRSVDLENFARAMPHTLSGGQQQRVALARALARSPRVMLLDEPFSGLDGRLREEVRKTTVDLLRQSGAATLIVTHDPLEALLLGDRVSVLQAGRLVQTGTGEEIYHRSKTLSVAEVFGPVNRFAGLVHNGTLHAPWGAVDASGLERAGFAEVTVRCESVVLQPAHWSSQEGVSGRVVAVDRVGGSCHVLVAVEGGATVRAWDLARAGWAVGDEVRLFVVADQQVVRALEDGATFL